MASAIFDFCILSPLRPGDQLHPGAQQRAGPAHRQPERLGPGEKHLAGDHRRFFLRHGGVRPVLLPAQPLPPHPLPGPAVRGGGIHPLAGRPRGPEQTRRGGEPKGLLLEGVPAAVCERKNHLLRHHHLHRLRLSRRGQRHHGGTTPAADLGGHRRVYDLGRGGRAVPGLPHQALPALQLRHGAVLALCAVGMVV